MMKQTMYLAQISRTMLLLSLTVLSGIVTAWAQITAFTYQGRLTDGAAANGIYDLQFVLYDGSGTQIATTQTHEDVTVTNGVFTVRLDFGAAAFAGADRSLEINVRRGAETGAFTTLAPRQPVTSTPYAIRALNAANADNATTAQNLTGSLAGDVSGTQMATVINAVGGKTSAEIANGVQLANNATSVNITDAIVRRDAVGGFSAGVMSVGSTRLTITGINNGSDSFRINSVPINNLALDGLIARWRSYVGGTTTFTDKFRFDNAGGMAAIGQLGYGIIPATGAGERMVWYPYKSAFRAGSVNAAQWDDTNIGFFSLAGGLNTTASGQSSFAAGDSTTASGLGSFAAGFRTIASGNYTTALGRYATTNDFDGSFIYGDGTGSTSNTVSAVANNSWTIRASGGYRFFTNSALTTGVSLSAGGGAWNTLSDRNAKENFGAVDSRDILRRVLKLPVVTWSYKGQTYRHIGATAQDFYAAFGVGESDKTITTVDPDGVAFAAIQGLYDELKERDASIDVQKSKIESLETQISQLQQQVNRQQLIIDGLKKLACAQIPTAAVCQ
jgi:hypothetical protein